MPTFIKNVRRETRSCSRRLACSPWGGESFSSMGSLLRWSSSGFWIRLPWSGGPLRNQPGAHIGNFVVGHGAAGNMVAPVGLADVGTAGDDGGAHGLFIDQRQERSVEDGAGAAAMLRVIAVAAGAGQDIYRLTFVHVAGIGGLVRRQILALNGVVLVPARTHALHDGVDLCIGQRAAGLGAERRHQRALLAVGNHVAQRWVVKERLVLGVGEIGGAPEIAVFAVAAGAILP